MRSEPYKFNCYDALGISPGATPDEIKSAYRKASLKAHPDVGGSNEAQARVNFAYEVLSDPIQRNNHDAYWRVSGARSARGTSQESPRTSPPGSQATGEVLSAFKVKLETAIRAARVRIWNTLSSRHKVAIEDVQGQFTQAQTSFYWTLGVGAISLLLAFPFQIFWIGVVGAGVTALSALNGVQIGGKKFSLFGTDRQVLVDHAEGVARQQCEIEVGALDQRSADFAQIVEVLTRQSSQYDDEINVARRISAALFVMGYAPVFYDSENRMMVFADGEAKLVARFRHRDGSSVNVTYVEKLHAFARTYGAKHALLFCSPGLSGNAAAYAERHGIRPYSLESMYQNSPAFSQESRPRFRDHIVGIDVAIADIDEISLQQRSSFATCLTTDNRN